MAKKSVPVSVTDFLMHAKVDEDCATDMERVLFPFTRYANVLHSPKFVKKVEDAPGAPYIFLITDTSEEMEISEIRSLLGDIY